MAALDASRPASRPSHGIQRSHPQTRPFRACFFVLGRDKSQRVAYTRYGNTDRHSPATLRVMSRDSHANVAGDGQTAMRP